MICTLIRQMGNLSTFLHTLFTRLLSNICVRNFLERMYHPNWMSDKMSTIRISFNPCLNTLSSQQTTVDRRLRFSFEIYPHIIRISMISTKLAIAPSLGFEFSDCIWFLSDVLVAEIWETGGTIRFSFEIHPHIVRIWQTLAFPETSSHSWTRHS